MSKSGRRPHVILFLASALYRSEVAHALQCSKYCHASFVVPPTSSLTRSAPAVYKRVTSSHSVVPRRLQLQSGRRGRNNGRIPLHFSLKHDEDPEISSAKNDDDERTSWLPSGDSSFAKYGRPKDITSDSFGPLLPIAEAVDEVTGGWGLSYADLHPATPRTTVGQAFLATNFFYAAAGLWLGWNGDWFFGGLTEIAGIVSFIYHYTQLEFGKNRSEVRLALLIDYFCAGSTLLTGGVYMLQAGITSVPIESLVSAAVAVACLSLCWVWEFGYPYIFWHSLWHITSAYTGYLIGQDHLSNIAG